MSWKITPNGAVQKTGSTSDQGSEYTSDIFIEEPAEHDIDISMDGKGAWRDNVFVERLWSSVKYEEVYLNAYESMGEAK